MQHKHYIEGFSKQDKKTKINWLVRNYLPDSPDAKKLLERYWHPDPEVQSLHESFIENTISNYWLPYAVAPNFLINNRMYAVPMVTEESSVVAAAAEEKLRRFFEQTRQEFLQRLKPFTENMEKRGGGILSVSLENWTAKMDNYYTITFRFNTADSMGANFINTILEEWSDYMAEAYPAYGHANELDIVLRILSNHNPNCRVHVRVQAPVEDLDKKTGVQNYARRFETAVNMAKVNPYRAVTHNKGIMNGIDAVVLATGNDFRAVEAGAHAYAARSGHYQSISYAKIENGVLTFGLEIPLAVGTVGGMTRLHPLARISMEILGNPGAAELMKIIGTVGLAQNFSAVHSLITEGIQKGHMRMHLNNILAQLNATPDEARYLREYFADRKAHVRTVKDALTQLRKKQ